MGDKPTCDRAPAEPGFVYPNAYFNNLQVRLEKSAIYPFAHPPHPSEKGQGFC